jgi:hypothetical protein
VKKITKICEIVSGMKKIVVDGYIAEKSDVREVSGRYDGNTYRVCNFLLSETKASKKENSITLVLWEEDIERFRVGDKVQIENGYATSFNANVQLNVGKFGKIKLAA